VCVWRLGRLAALRITPELHEASYVRVGKGTGALATQVFVPQTPIACLLETYKPMCAVKDQNSMLPLHYAAKNGASALVIRRLLEAYPAAASVRSFGQRTALHWGAESRLEPAALKLLIEAYPGALALKDAFGNLPKDLAARGVQSMLQ
jgi:ankyrin repeat protein